MDANQQALKAKQFDELTARSQALGYDSLSLLVDSLERAHQKDTVVKHLPEGLTRALSGILSSGSNSGEFERQRG